MHGFGIISQNGVILYVINKETLIGSKRLSWSNRMYILHSFTKSSTLSTSLRVCWKKTELRTTFFFFDSKKGGTTDSLCHVLPNKGRITGALYYEADRYVFFWKGAWAQLDWNILEVLSIHFFDIFVSQGVENSAQFIDGVKRKNPIFIFREMSLGEIRKGGGGEKLKFEKYHLKTIEIRKLKIREI